MGGSDGKIYELDVSTPSDDGGTASVTTTRTSKLFVMPQGEATDISGVVTLKQFSQSSTATITLTFQWQGTTVADFKTVINVEGVSAGLPVYSDGTGPVYYGGSFYYGVPFSGRLRSQFFDAYGAGSHIEVKCDIENSEDVEIEEIRFRLSNS